LAGSTSQIFFSCCRLKYSFLITYGLGIGLNPGKILSRKDLQPKYSGIRTYLRTSKTSWDRRAKNCWESSRACSELALSEILSKGCSSQEMGFLLWKAVEKRWGVGAMENIPWRISLKSSRRAGSGTWFPLCLTDPGLASWAILRSPLRGWGGVASGAGFDRRVKIKGKVKEQRTGVSTPHGHPLCWWRRAKSKSWVTGRLSEDARQGTQGSPSALVTTRITS
jgi:hypothetical protein